MEAEIAVALLALIGMEIVLGIDNLIFIALLTNRLPAERRKPARRVGLGMAVLLRFVMLAGASWLLTLTQPWFALGTVEFSAKDLILLAGGFFLIAKATIEIHERVDVAPREEARGEGPAPAVAGFWTVVAQIVAIDLVFSVDSILAAVGLVREFWMIALAICISVGAMLLSMDRLSDFMEHNPSVVMLALAFLVVVGVVLVAEGFGVHFPKEFVYAAMAFATLVEALNIMARRAARRRRQGAAAQQAE